MRLDPPVVTRIYGLLDPVSGELRYIGKTVKTLRHRLRGHLFDSKKKSNYRERWVSSLLVRGLQPAIEEFDVVEGDGSAEEIACIGVARALGCRLTNGTDGGDGAPGRELSAETRRKIGDANKKQLGAKRSAQMRARLSDAMKGNKRCAGRSLTDTHKARISDALKGITVSEETKKKHRLRMLGTKQTPEAIRKNRATNKANHFFKVLVRSAVSEARSKTRR